MEPGERHREHLPSWPILLLAGAEPQWSPVNVTGNTPPDRPHSTRRSMPQWSPVNVTGNTFAWLAVNSDGTSAAMEPGERHREHTAGSYVLSGRSTRRNGAR